MSQGGAADQPLKDKFLRKVWGRKYEFGKDINGSMNSEKILMKLTHCFKSGAASIKLWL